MRSSPELQKNQNGSKPKIEMASVFNPIRLLPTLGNPNSHSSLIFQNLTLKSQYLSTFSLLSSLFSLSLSLLSLCSQSQVSRLNSQPLTPCPPRIHSFPNPSWPPPHHHSTVTGSRLRLTFQFPPWVKGLKAFSYSVGSCSRISFLVSTLKTFSFSGCKFSLEEERVVIELQAQFGNKWARIATYLPGRTDNDVKNFWSSRQKRLARILQTSGTANKPQKNKRAVQTCHDVPASQAAKYSSSSEGESSSKAQSASSSCIENYEMIKMVPLTDLLNPKLVYFGKDLAHHELSQDEKNSCTESQSQIPFSEIPQPKPELTFSPESQELLAKLEDSNIFDMFGTLDACELGNGAQLPIGAQLFEPVGSCRSDAKENIDNPITPDSFFDDFPTDVFDHIEPHQSPSER